MLGCVGSFRPYWAGRFAWDIFPGLRFACPGLLSTCPSWTTGQRSKMKGSGGGGSGCARGRPHDNRSGEWRYKPRKRASFINMNIHAAASWRCSRNGPGAVPEPLLESRIVDSRSLPESLLLGLAFRSRGLGCRLGGHCRLGFPEAGIGLDERFRHIALGGVH